VFARPRWLMLLSAALAIPYGVACLVAPEWWMGVWEIPVASGALLARMYGGQVLGFGVLSLLASGLDAGDGLRAILRGFCFVDAVSFGLALWAVTTGQVGASGWIDVAGFFALSSGFGYYALRA
jgi:hypothetical protein